MGFSLWGKFTSLEPVNNFKLFDNRHDQFSLIFIAPAIPRKNAKDSIKCPERDLNHKLIRR